VNLLIRVGARESNSRELGRQDACLQGERRRKRGKGSAGWREFTREGGRGPSESERKGLSLPARAV